LLYVAAFRSIKSQSDDYFFLLDEELRFAIVKYDNGKLISKKEGNVIYSNSELIDNDYLIFKGYSYKTSKVFQSSYIGIHSYENKLTIIPITILERSVDIRATPFVINLPYDKIVDI